MDNNILQEANKFVRAILLGTVVESFGVSNQNHFIEFRNDFDEDILLNIDTEIQLYPEFKIQGITLDEYKLLVFNRLNLQKIKDVGCSSNADLNISFENGYELRILGKPLDETTDEPWQLSNKKAIGSEDGKLIIALSNNGFAIWQ
jgi:hypothetical protein